LLEERFVTFTCKNPDTGKVGASSVAAHVGVFESKKTGERFVAVAAHYESNWYNDTAQTGSKYYGTGVENRKAQVDTLMAALAALPNGYADLPMVIGGDYNSPAKGRTVAGQTFVDACQYMTSQYGWKDCQTVAKETDCCSGVVAGRRAATISVGEKASVPKAMPKVRAASSTSTARPRTRPSFKGRPPAGVAVRR